MGESEETRGVGVQETVQAIRTAVENIVGPDRPFGLVQPPITHDELAESLLFFRRRCAEKIVRDAIRTCLAQGTHPDKMFADLPRYAEDLANALTERLAARETGRPEGYRR